jgi:hypothetical protein
MSAAGDNLWRQLRSPRGTSFRLAVLVSVLLGVAYLWWAPLVPDLAAQVARANVVHSSGLTSWWTGWFGGLSLPTYSVLVPPSMAVFGVRVTGLAAVAIGTIATTSLVRDTRRPRAGAIAFAIAGLADLVDGRVTFTAGLALAAWALVALRSRRGPLCVALAMGAYFASPLAGLFLGMVLVAVAVADRSRRTSAIVVAASLLLVGVAMALLFPGTGTMPFTVTDAIPAGLGYLGVVVLCPDRVIRLSAAIVLGTFPLLLIVPGPIGDNITRLAWVCAAPIVVACAPLPRRYLAVAMAALAIWPISDLVEQVSFATNASVKAAYYEPLEQHLAQQQAAAGGAAIGERVELVDTVNHWGSVYLGSMPLARGWDRQADVANNPIFYDTALLNASSYHAWLNQLAVGWVALPAAPLDYASVQEAKLIRGGLSYLKLTWSSRTWRVYQVVNSAPLVSGARVETADNSGLTLTTSAAGTVGVRMRWSPYLTVRDPTSGASVSSCVIDANGWVNVVLPRAETIRLSSQFDPRARLIAPDPDCTTDVLTGR